MAKFTFILLFTVVAVKAIPEIQYDLEKAEEYFQAFIEEYGKEYENEDVKERKFEVFKESLKMYNKINLEQLYAKFGIHEHSDLTSEELQKKRRGFRRMSDIGSQYTRRETPAVNPPEAYDWELQGSAVTPVKEQLCGDSFAFATTANIESQYAKKYGKMVDLSEQQIVDCDKTNLGCYGGDTIDATTEIMRVGGQMSRKDYPYTGVEDKCLFNSSQVQVKVTGCDFYIPKSEDDLVKMLFKEGPLAVGIDATALDGYNGGILTPCSFRKCDHGVLLVGYGVENNKKFWRIKNSWGKKFGESGYFRVERGNNPCGILSCPIITSAVV